MIRHPDGDRIRRLFEERARDIDTRDDCPSPERLWEAVSGSLPIGQLDDVAAHATTCAACAEEWRLGLDVVRNHVVPMESTPSWVRWALPVAAMLLLGLLVAPMWRSIDDSAPSEFRTSPSDVEIVSTIPADEPLDRDDCVLRWTGPEVAVYEVVVTTLDTTILARVSNLRDTQFRVPAEALASTPDGGTIVWHVQARAPDGTRPAPLTVRSRVGSTGR